jgi:hypothetical protein
VQQITGACAPSGIYFHKMAVKITLKLDQRRANRAELSYQGVDQIGLRSLQFEFSYCLGHEKGVLQARGAEMVKNLSS